MSRAATDTPARTALQAWISAKGRGAQADLATRLGVSIQLVNQWLAGSCRPGHVFRDALELVTEIDPRDWETNDERKRRTRAMAGPPEEPSAPAATGTDDVKAGS